jgi:hypothetical protein
MHPNAQMGPLALLLALLPRLTYLVIIAAVVLLLLMAVAFAACHSRDGLSVRLTAIIGAGFLVAPWSQLAWKGHADDALVLCGAAWMIVALQRRARGIASVALAIAVLGKPTAFVLGAAWVGSLSETLLAFGIVSAVWLPFFIADPAGLLHAGRGVMPVGHGSLPDYLGYQTGERIPVWIRPVQLVGGLIVGYLGSFRDRLPEGILAAFAVRALIETNPAPAYSIPLVGLALLADVARNGFPIFIPAAAVSFWTSQGVLNGGSGLLRIASLVVLLTSASVSFARTSSVAKQEFYSGSVRSLHSREPRCRELTTEEILT